MPLRRGSRCPGAASSELVQSGRDLPGGAVWHLVAGSGHISSSECLSVVVRWMRRRTYSKGRTVDFWLPVSFRAAAAILSAVSFPNVPQCAGSHWYTECLPCRRSYALLVSCAPLNQIQAAAECHELSPLLMKSKTGGVLLHFSPRCSSLLWLLLLSLALGLQSRRCTPGAGLHSCRRVL